VRGAICGRRIAGGVKGLRDASRLEPQHPDAERTELGGPLPAEALDRVEGDARAARPGMAEMRGRGDDR